MKVCDRELCRLGNAIFRYIASTLFCIIYKAERIDSIEFEYSENTQVITDDFFLLWYNRLIKQELTDIPLNHTYFFDGYYQHDQIYKTYKKEIIQWIHTPQ